MMSYQKRFWLALVLSLPMLVDMILMPFGVMLAWIQLDRTAHNDADHGFGTLIHFGAVPMRDF